MKKDIIKPMLLIATMLFISFSLYSCSNDEDDEQNNEIISDNHENEFNYDKLSEIAKKIIDTKWKLIKKIEYKPQAQTTYNNSSNGVIFFSKNLIPKEYSWDDDKFELYLDNKLVGHWNWGKNWDDDNDKVGTNDVIYFGWDTGNDDLDSEYYAKYASYIPDIVSITNNNLSIVKVYYEKYGLKTNWIYNLVEKGQFNKDLNNGKYGEHNDVNTNYEKPHIGFNDFTATKKSVNVTFNILNKDYTKVTSASVKYGENTPIHSVQATLTKAQIKATISGLKSGTTYYVQAIAHGPGGSEESEIVKVATNN